MTDPSAKSSAIRWVKNIGFTVILTLLGIYIYYPFSPAVKQQKNMAMGERHLPKLRSLVTADPRFSKVKSDVYTGNGGSIVLRGMVKSEDHLTDLKNLVATSLPPVAVTWFVKVISPPAFDEIDP